MGDAMLLGVVDAETSARESRHARAVLYHPRAAEVWVCEQGRVVERIPIEDPVYARLGRAAGTNVHVAIDAGGRTVLQVSGGAPVVVPFEMPAAVRPCARLGTVGDVVALRRADAADSAAAD